MIIQATPYGTKKEEPFAFTYSGDFTDSRVDGIGDVTLNTSGQLITTGQTVTVRVYILGAGGGCVRMYSDGFYYFAPGGGGGNQTVEVELAPGTYDIIVGSGGAAQTVGPASSATAGKGGDTTAFGCVSTGGIGGFIGAYGGSPAYGAGGTPNGNAGTANAGGSPNGGGIVNNAPQPGGNGLVRITFS